MKFPGVTIRSRLLALVAVTLAPSLAIIAANETEGREERYEEVHDLALQRGHLAALEIQGVVNGVRDLLRTIAADEAVRTFQGDACARRLAEVERLAPQIHAIVALDPEGRVRCTSRVSGEPLVLSDRTYVRDLIENGRFTIGGYVAGRLSGEPSLPLGTPMRGEDGEITGVLIGGLSLKWLDELLRLRSLPHSDALAIADADGVILARRPHPERFVGTRIPEPYLSLVRTGTPGTMELTSQDGTRRVIGYYPPAAWPARGLYVSAGVALDEAMAPADAALRRDVLIVVAGAAFSVTAALALGTLLIQRPLDTIRNTVTRWRGGDETARTGMPEGDNEILGVGAAVDRFMDDIVAERRARREAEASRDVAARELQHRVKNLLATVQALAARSFDGAANPNEGLRRFRERLGALAVSHRALVEDGWTNAALRELVDGVIEPFGREHFRIRGETMRVSARGALALSLALHELCTNASKYGALSEPGGRVELAWRSEGGRFRLDWREIGGPPVAPPQRKGFGSTLIERLMSHELGGEVALDYDVRGLRAALTAPMEALTAPRSPEPG